MKRHKRKGKLNQESLKKLREKAEQSQRSNHLAKAAQYYKQYLASSPQNAAVCHDLGTVYYLQGKHTEALACYKKVITLQPEHPQAHYNLANLYTLSHQIELAVASYKKAISLEPKNIDALNNLATIYYDQGDVEKASQLFELALALAPQNHQARSVVVSAQNYIPGVPPSRQFSLATDWWQQHGKPLYHKILYRNTPIPDRKLKIAFLSPDLREHSISYFFIPLIKHLNRDKVTVTCYSDTTKPDHITEQIHALADHWCDTSSTTDSQLARLIEREGIDILIDLAGHMINNRLLVFARQPAPVQISWLGYPNTTGLPTIQYRLTDEIADPVGQADKYHSEKLIRMPAGFLCYSPPEESPAVRPKDISLKEITFASFNNPAKINDRTIKTWSSILTTTPKAKLLLKGRLLANNLTRQNFTRKFSANGVQPEQIVYLPFCKTTKEHLDLYNMVDICLDTFPYNGTTTTCEALWMGVPVITLRGEQHAARVGASLLSRVGLADLIAKSEEEYITLATRISHDKERLHKLHQDLRTLMQTSPLCDAPNFGQAAESVFRRTWHKWCEAQQK